MSNFTIPRHATFLQLLASRQADLQITDIQLARALGYQGRTVIDVIKQGRMHLPTCLIPALAGVLGVDRGALMRLHLSEVDRELLRALELCWGCTAAQAM